MPGTFEIISEREEPTGWRFDVQDIRADGSLAGVVLTLSWADYDYFCPDGSVAPEGVARAVLDVACALWPQGMPARLDASTPRRMAPDADQRITERVDMRSM
jgi:hypothetical protein